MQWLWWLSRTRTESMPFLEMKKRREEFISKPRLFLYLSQEGNFLVSANSFMKGARPRFDRFKPMNGHLASCWWLLLLKYLLVGFLSLLYVNYFSSCCLIKPIRNVIGSKQFDWQAEAKRYIGSEQGS